MSVSLTVEDQRLLEMRMNTYKLLRIDKDRLDVSAWDGFGSFEWGLLSRVKPNRVPCGILEHLIDVVKIKS